MLPLYLPALTRILAKADVLSVHDFLELSATSRACREAIWNDRKFWTSIASYEFAKDCYVLSYIDWETGRDVLVDWANCSTERRRARARTLHDGAERAANDGRFDVATKLYNKTAETLAEICKTKGSSRGPSTQSVTPRSCYNEKSFEECLCATLSRNIVYKPDERVYSEYEREIISNEVSVRILSSFAVLSIRGEEISRRWFRGGGWQDTFTTLKLWIDDENVLDIYSISSSDSDESVESDSDEDEMESRSERFILAFTKFLDNLFWNTYYEREEKDGPSTPWLPNGTVNPTCATGENLDLTRWDHLVVRDKMGIIKCVNILDRLFFGNFTLSFSEELAERFDWSTSPTTSDQDDQIDADPEDETLVHVEMDDGSSQ